MFENINNQYNETGYHFIFGSIPAIILFLVVLYYINMVVKKVCFPFLDIPEDAGRYGMYECCKDLQCRFCKVRSLCCEVAMKTYNGG